MDAEQAARARLAEWGVRHICSFIGAQAQIDTSKSGGRNPLVDAAAEIDVFGTREQDPRERELEEMRGEKVADDWRNDPRLSRPVAADPETGTEAANPEGSYEAFLHLMGGGMRPAMRDVNGSGDG